MPRADAAGPAEPAARPGELAYPATLAGGNGGGRAPMAGRRAVVPSLSRAALSRSRRPLSPTIPPRAALAGPAAAVVWACRAGGFTVAILNGAHTNGFEGGPGANGQNGGPGGNGGAGGNGATGSGGGIYLWRARSRRVAIPSPVTTLSVALEAPAARRETVARAVAEAGRRRELRRRSSYRRQCRQRRQWRLGRMGRPAVVTAPLARAALFRCRRPGLVQRRFHRLQHCPRRRRRQGRVWWSWW